MDVYIARQPILDRKKQLFAYEVLCRSSMVNSFPVQMDSDEATYAVLAHVLLNVGLDTITGNRREFINFTERHLLAKTPLQLPRERCINEILETVRPTSEILEVCQELGKEGYLLALDDFVFNDELNRYSPLSASSRLTSRPLTGRD
jgi:c-di-GMP phosphodiesterase